MEKSVNTLTAQSSQTDLLIPKQTDLPFFWRRFEFSEVIKLVIITIIQGCTGSLLNCKFTTSNNNILPLIAFPFILFTINTLITIQHCYRCYYSIDPFRLMGCKCK